MYSQVIDSKQNIVNISSMFSNANINEMFDIVILI